MRSTPERTRAIADYFLNTVNVGENRWFAFSRFREAVLGLSTDELLDLVVKHLEVAEEGSPRQCFLYEMAIHLCYQAKQPHAQVVFERLYDSGDSRSFLQELRTRWVTTRLEDGYSFGSAARTIEKYNSREKVRQDFARDSNEIRSGKHLGWLAYLGKLYFGLYADIERNLAPRERLAQWLGDANTEVALEGFQAVLSRSDVPTFGEVLELIAEHQLFDWWFSLVAGMNERWAAGKRTDDLSDDFLKGLVAFDLANPVTTEEDGSERRLVHPWKQALLEQRPELIRDAYVQVVRSRLSRAQEHAEGLYELLTETPLEPFRKDAVLGLLHDFPNTSVSILNQLLDSVIALPTAHADLLALAAKILSGATVVGEHQRDIWLVTGYRLSPPLYESDIEARAKLHHGLVFDLRDRSSFSVSGKQAESALLPVLEFIARLTGTCYPDTPHPTGGWSGDRNPWDAAEYCRLVVNAISAIPSEAATRALIRLEANPTLASYRSHILYALANQRQRRREVEYDRSDWRRTVLALANGSPATVSDLHALTVDHLHDIRRRIERENIDLYKQFWNVDGFGRPQEPRPEESCRDFLVGLMRPRLSPLGVMVEPEGHMVADKRADISVAMPGRKILCELKRDYHAEVWTAAEQQLDRFYAHDPDANGFGIYCVYGSGKKGRQSFRYLPADYTDPSRRPKWNRCTISYSLPRVNPALSRLSSTFRDLCS
jgi:hypothetical protein